MTDDTYTEQNVKNNPKFKMLDDINFNMNMESKEEFLAKFPKNVIKNGNIIPIREELEKRFQETNTLDVNKLNSNEPILVPTPVSGNESAY
mmetsp:Transcript_37003/g.27352  ORF Transcript_37003/g.27352 Transcript_37003/m.27352 type:complete len:91 (-) Transcript_37003:259-531(-)